MAERPDGVARFIGRWLASLVIAFTLFPILFVLWRGPDADFGWIGGMVVMAFAQFISPYQFWIIPLCAGTILAGLWHYWREGDGNDRRVGDG